MRLICKQNHTRIDGVNYQAGDTYEVTSPDLLTIYELEEAGDETWANFGDIFEVHPDDAEALRIALGNLRIIEPDGELPFTETEEEEEEEE